MIQSMQTRWIMPLFDVFGGKNEKIFKENTNKKYKKSEEKIYNILCENGDENKAIQRAREKYYQLREEYSQPSKMIGCTTVYKLVEELKGKIDRK